MNGKRYCRPLFRCTSFVLLMLLLATGSFTIAFGAVGMTNTGLSSSFATSITKYTGTSCLHRIANDSIISSDHSGGVIVREPNGTATDYPANPHCGTLASPEQAGYEYEPLWAYQYESSNGQNVSLTYFNADWQVPGNPSCSTYCTAVSFFDGIWNKMGNPAGPGLLTNQLESVLVWDSATYCGTYYSWCIISEYFTTSAGQYYTPYVTVNPNDGIQGQVEYYSSGQYYSILTQDTTTSEGSVTEIQQSAAGNLYNAVVSMTLFNNNGYDCNNLPYYPSSVTFDTFSTSYSGTGTINTASGSNAVVCGLNLVGQVLAGDSVSIAWNPNG